MLTRDAKGVDTPTGIDLRWRLTVEPHEVLVYDCHYGKEISLSPVFVFQFRDPSTGRFDFGINRALEEIFEQEITRHGK